jgi:hypothetical protein
MSRIKQNQIIDIAILSIENVIKSQCSLSEQDLIVLNKHQKECNFLKGKKVRQMSKFVMKLLKLLNS